MEIPCPLIFHTAQQPLEGYLIFRAGYSFGRIPAFQSCYGPCIRRVLGDCQIHEPNGGTDRENDMGLSKSRGVVGVQSLSLFLQHLALHPSHDPCVISFWGLLYLGCPKQCTPFHLKVCQLRPNHGKIFSTNWDLRCRRTVTNHTQHLSKYQSLTINGFWSIKTTSIFFVMW